MDNKWNKSIDELEKKREYLLCAGGEDRIKKQHSSGKLTARERLEALFDDDTFVEIDNMILSRAVDFDMNNKKKPGDGVVVGYGEILGRIVFASSQDFTIGGGSLGEAQAMKICRIMDMALEVKAPYISINDSGGARIEEGIDALSGYAEIFYRNTISSGVIPQIAVILGPCAGGACYSPAICDFIFMTESTSQMYITGPSVVKSVTGEIVTSNELGGSKVHSTLSGVSHFCYSNDLDCLNGVRRLIGYLPQNNETISCQIKGKEIDKCEAITKIVPDNSKKAYDVRDVINTFVDCNSFFEIQIYYAMNIVIGFARLSGKTIGIVANQSNYIAGSLEINAADKGARFVRFCDSFNIPLLTMVDVPAFLPGSQQEHNGIIRHGAKLLYAYSEASVPKVTLIMRKAYGGAYIAMCSKGLGADVVYAWPIAEIAVMGAAGAVSIIGRKEIANSENPENKKEELMLEYNNQFMNPYKAAEHGFVDEVILPIETKKKIVLAFKMLENKKVNRIIKKHGNIPL